MRFTCIDRIIELEPNVQLTAVKNVSLSEEYLADHFPRFPVLPGVLMLEATTQASAWLVRVSDDFAHSMVVLNEARNVKFADFVAPGHTLVVTAKMTDPKPSTCKLSVQGTVNDKPVITARLVVKKYNLADSDPQKANVDQLLKQHLRDQFKLLR